MQYNSLVNNKIKYLIIPNKNKNIVSIKFLVACGFYNEYSGINNYTHLLEHLLAYYFNKKECSVNKIKKLLNKKIYTTNAYTNDEHMCIYINCYQNDLSFFLNLLSRTIFNLCITKENLSMSKKNVIKELKQFEDYHLNNCLNTYIFKRNKVDFNEGIKDVSKCKIDDITKFYKNIFSKNMIIGVTCNSKNITKNKKLILRNFNKKIEIQKNKYPINFNATILKKNTIFKHYKEINSIQVEIVLPIDIQIYTKQYWELKIILDYMFDFEKGPFYKKLRIEEKIIYSITYNLKKNYENTNKTLLIISSNIEEDNLNKFLKLFDKLFKNLKMNNEIFSKIKKKLLFKTNYIYITEHDHYLKYYLNNYLNNIKITYTKNLKNLKNAKNNKTLLKGLKKTKYYIFLFNKNYKKI
tara:strand:- start:4175 stop:5404 length:1230 start_codon:yes stop_codon:yes gene_type:complete